MGVAAAGGDSTTVRARGTALSSCVGFIAAAVFWCTVVVRHASARAGVRLGVSTAAARWRTVRDSRFAGGGSSTAIRAVGRGLRGSSCTIRVEQSSAAGGFLTGSRLRDGDRGRDRAEFGPSVFAMTTPPV